MRRIVRPSALLLAAFLLGPAPAAAQTYPDEPGGGIADLANALAPADADSIRAALYRMRANPGVEVRVLTVRNVAAYGASSPEAFATAIYNHWNLGYQQRQDGVLVLLSVDDRFTRIELGDGVPAEQDAEARRIVDEQMVPRLRAGDVSGGLREGVLGLAGAFNTPAWAAPAGAPPVHAAPETEPVVRTSGRRYRREPELSAGALAAILLVGGLLAAGGAWFYVSRLRHRCKECGGEMVRVPEDADDVYLDSGRRREEVLGSVDYHVWKCAGCGSHAAVREPRLSHHDRCAECGYRTVGTTRTVVESPTYTSAGAEQVERKCGHCGWADVDVIHLPPKRRSEPLRAADLQNLAHLAADLADTASARQSGSGGASGGSAGGSSGGESTGGHSSGRGASGRW